MSSMLQITNKSLVLFLCLHNISLAQLPNFGLVTLDAAVTTTNNPKTNQQPHFPILESVRG